MNPKLLLRIAAGCLLFFAVGHSIGHFTRHNVTDPKAKEILQLMTDYKFDLFGKMRSYEENYTGMSLNLIFTLLAFGAITWYAASLTEKQGGSLNVLLIPIALCVFGFSITSFLFFFPVPGITSLIASGLISLSIYKLNQEKTRN